MYSMKKYLLLFLCLTLGVAYAQDTLRVRVMTYNLRFGELASLEELAHHIKSFKPDFVALQEVDSKTDRKRTPHQKGKDFISELAYHTGMFGLYGKTIDYSTGYYGIGMLSKYPYISVQKIMLPHPVKEHERRAMLEGLFEMGNDTIVFTSTHLDVNSQETRAEQIKFITGHFKNYKYPVILGGDFNARHYSEAIRGMDSWFAASNDDFGMPAWKPVIKIDYLFAYPQKGWRVISTQTVQSLLSDHLPIITELEYVKEADPLMKFRRMLLRYKRLTEEELLQIEAESKKELSAANRKALAAPEPDPKSIYDFVMPEPYQPQKYKEGTHQEEGEKTFLVNAINETLKAEFRHNPDTFIWGQDVANREKGGVFNVTKGMQQEFGEARVFSAPIAEDYIVGTANGMSRFDPKIHVVIEGAEFADYFWPAVEQYVECTHEYWRSNGKFAPNITLRLASGGYIGGGLYHSQNIEGALTTLPGARIVCPSFADDAAGLLRTSMRSKGFTLFLEPKALYNSVEAAAVVPEDFEVPFGKARIRREGTDLSIITYGNTTHFCLHVAEQLEKESGWKVEVIDIRSLIPLDKEAIFESVKKTSKALVVHEDKVFSGFGAELAAMIGTDMFRYLDGPVQRVGSTFTPVGFNPILEKEILPDEAKIYEAAKKLLEY